MQSLRSTLQQRSDAPHQGLKGLRVRGRCCPTLCGRWMNPTSWLTPKKTRSARRASLSHSQSGRRFLAGCWARGARRLNRCFFKRPRSTLSLLLSRRCRLVLVPCRCTSAGRSYACHRRRIPRTTLWQRHKTLPRRRSGVCEAGSAARRASPRLQLRCADAEHPRPN